MEKIKKNLTKMGLNPKFYGNFKDFHQEQMEKDPAYRKEYERLELQKKVAELVTQKRQEKHLSQQDLAKRVETTQSVISRIERGSVSVGLQMLQRIALALDSKVEIALL